MFSTKKRPRYATWFGKSCTSIINATIGFKVHTVGQCLDNLFRWSSLDKSIRASYAFTIFLSPFEPSVVVILTKTKIWRSPFTATIERFAICFSDIHAECKISYSYLRIPIMIWSDNYLILSNYCSGRLLCDTRMKDWTANMNYLFVILNKIQDHIRTW